MPGVLIVLKHGYACSNTISILSCLIASSCTHNKCNQVCDVRKVRHYYIIYSSFSSARRSKPFVWVQIVEALWMWRSLGHFLQRCNIRWWVIEREWKSWNKETIAWFAWSLVLSAFCGLRKTKHANSYLRSELCSWSRYSYSHPGNESQVRREVKRKHIWSILQTKQTHTVPGQTTSASSPISSPSIFCKLNKHITLAHKQQVPAHYHHQYFGN